MQSQAFTRQSEAEVSHGLLCNVCCLFFFFFGCSLFFCHSAIPIILQPQPQALCKNKCNLSPLAVALSQMCNPTTHLPGLWSATTNPRPLAQRWALRIYSARITKANIHTRGVHPCRWIQFYFFLLPTLRSDLPETFLPAAKYRGMEWVFICGT